MLRVLLGRIWPYIAGVAGLIAGFFFVRLSGKAAGKQEVQAKQVQADIKGMNDAREARNEIDSLDDDAVRDRARERLRDGKR